MARHILTKEERQKGGRSKSTKRYQLTPEDRSKAFWTTMERYPFMGRKYLKNAPGMKNYSERFDPKKGN